MATHFKQQSSRFNLAPIRELFKPTAAAEPKEQNTERWLAFAQEGEQDPAEDVLPRFPIVRQGYDRPAVDEYIAELEHDLADADRELAGVRGRTAPADEVNRELKRIGEQTSAVLIAAHEQQEQILRAAQGEADRCVAEARAKAATMTAEAEAQIREIEARKAEAVNERERVYDEIRRFSTALAALIETPAETGPPEE